MPQTVLLVEDEPDLARVMTVSLSRAGFDVLVSGTAADAVKVVASVHVDIIVTDRGLPDGDGMELVRRLRSDGFAGGILVASGRSGPAHDEECRAAGADGVLAKPFRLADLAAGLHALAPSQPDAVVCS
ncbi:DNA-binding response OmpR family regulator [Nocardioides sp. BE266]|uniref:response regulator transcription factor n=1 Tax=Nocardioides sp. BE266 TaxID=2817725 RepID=UPI0028638184|nr:response regulator [Nocardioides sp. BE266]MDR7251419.1 DNA-binding response OmpR family regulator [Nocardioides sp. BE266]